MAARDHIDSKDYGNLLMMFRGDIGKTLESLTKRKYKFAKLRLTEMLKNLERMSNHDGRKAMD